MMSERILADNIQKYRVTGYPLTPLKGKAPFLPGYPSFAHNLPSQKTIDLLCRQYPDHNIGLVLGTPVHGGTKTAAIDLDIDDNRVEFVRAAIGGNPPVRRGARGVNIYILLPDDIKTHKFKDHEGNEIGSVLASGAVSVLPPSKHPKTSKPYVWLTHPLHEVPPSELPVVSKDLLNFITRVLAREECDTLLTGAHTHDPSLTLAGATAFLTTEEIYCRSVARLLPTDYKGNLLKELPEHYQSAIKKGLGKDAGSDEYEPRDQGAAPLGIDKDGNCVFFHPKLKTMVVKSPKQLTTPGELLSLAPAEIWRSLAPAKNAMGYNPHTIADMLVRACIAKGKIDPSRIRGFGTWRNRDGTIIENVTGPVPESGQYIYTRAEELDFNPGQTVKPHDVLTWMELFKWKTPGEAILMFAWVCYAPICGALRARPHVLLTGQKNTGKTTLLTGIEGLLDPVAIVCDGSTTTEAGIRQKLGENARAVMSDEFEAGDLGRRQRIIALARSAYSANAAGVKGTPSGRQMEFLLTTTFLFAGTSMLRGTAADASRVFTLELTPHDSNEATKQKIESEKERFMAKQTDWALQRIRQADTMLKSMAAFEPLMPGIESRAKKNLSIAFGAAFTALHDRVPNVEEIEEWTKRYAKLIEIHVEGHEQRDDEECLSYLLSQNVPGGSNIWRLVADAIKPAPLDTDPNNWLQTYGLRVGDGMLYVSDNHGFLVRLFQNSDWPKGAWKHQLSRLDGAVRTKKQFQGLEQRCTGIPLAQLALGEADNGAIDA